MRETDGERGKERERERERWIEGEGLRDRWRLRSKKNRVRNGYRKIGKRKIGWRETKDTRQRDYVDGLKTDKKRLECKTDRKGEIRDKRERDMDRR